MLEYTILVRLTQKYSAGRQSRDCQRSLYSERVELGCLLVHTNRLFFVKH